MGGWRFVFMLVLVVGAYVLFAHEYLFPEISHSISSTTSDVTFPSTDVGTAMHRGLLDN